MVFPSGDREHLIDSVAINMDADAIHSYMRQKKVTDTNVEKLKRAFKVAVYLLSLVHFLCLNERKEIEDKVELTAYLMKGTARLVLPLIVNEALIKDMEGDEE